MFGYLSTSIARLFTPHVCAWAQEVWPEVNLQRLFEIA